MHPNIAKNSGCTLKDANSVQNQRIIRQLLFFEKELTSVFMSIFNLLQLEPKKT
jgi:hypothetical protein